MKVVCWNMHNRDVGWPLLLECEPDLALLQEVRNIPEAVARGYEVVSRKAVRKTGQPQRFSTVVLTKGAVALELPLS